MFRKFLDGQPPVGSDIGRTSDRNFPKVAPLVPSHCGLRGNERADELAKESAALPQEEVPVDVRTVVRAAARAAKSRVCRQRPSGWYRDLMAGAPAAAGRRPGPGLGGGHPPTAGRPLHWAGSAQYLHRIGKKRTAECTGCNGVNSPAGLCLVCRESWCKATC